MTDETANDFIDSEANNDDEPTGEDPDGTIDVAHPTAEAHNAETDEAAGENSAEDN